jgi:hydrogenase maturation protease
VTGAFDTTRPDVLVIGVGNDYRSDDAVGLIVARALRPLVPAWVEVMETSGDGSILMEAWQKRRAVILIDAVDADANAGMIYRFDLAADEIPPSLLSSTHAFGIAEAVELARSLQELPPRVLVFGIQAKLLAYGIGISAEVALAAGAVVERVQEALRHFEEDRESVPPVEARKLSSGRIRSHR